MSNARNLGELLDVNGKIDAEAIAAIKLSHPKP
jgi:hypothetical protein